MKPIKTKEWKYTGEHVEIDTLWSVEEIRETFPEGTGNLVDALLTRCLELEEEIKRLQEVEKQHKALKLQLRLNRNKRKEEGKDEVKDRFQRLFYNRRG